MFSLFQGLIQYEIVGVYPAPTFFDVDKYSGGIRIIRDLKEDQIATGLYTVNHILKISFLQNTCTCY